MTTEDAELLQHYLARGHEPWNLSLESAWLDYELRSFVLSRLPAHRPLSVCNVGIGVGLWDDWLAHAVGHAITSVDRDPEICRIFEIRQRRERHPFPSKIICADVRDGVLDGCAFDVITCVGSTLDESGDRGRTQQALLRALAPAGQLLLGEVGRGAHGDRVLARGDMWLACSTRTL